MIAAVSSERPVALIGKLRGRRLRGAFKMKIKIGPLGWSVGDVTVSENFERLVISPGDRYVRIEPIGGARFFDVFGVFNDQKKLCRLCWEFCFRCELQPYVMIFVSYLFTLCFYDLFFMKIVNLGDRRLQSSKHYSQLEMNNR